MNSYWDHFEDIDQKYMAVKLNTPTPVIECDFNGNKLFIKDENENQNGSFKDRGVSYQMAKHIQHGKTKFALSSSGNSAISCSSIAVFYDGDLELFLSNKINPSKLNKIKGFSNPRIKINLSEKPRSDLIKFLNHNPEYVNLRGSNDNYAIPGFKTIAYEIIEQLPEVDAIFIPCSSGTSALGISQGFKELNLNIPIHICQTEKIHAIAKYFDDEYIRQNASLADAITDRLANRKKDVVELIKVTKVFGWVISDIQLVQDKDIVTNLINKDYSYNSVLAFSGWRKALKKGYNYKNPVLLFSGL